MIVYRATDASVVQAILSHPRVKPDIWEHAGDPPVPMHETIYHLIASRGKEAMGVAAFIPFSGASWDVHMAVLAKHRGCGTQFLKLALEWMFKNTACRKVTCCPPIDKVAMIRVAEKCGFRREGLSPKSLPWHGAMLDRVLLGREKESE